MKKFFLLTLAVVIIGVFIYFNMDLFLSRIPLPRVLPEYVEVSFGAEEGGSALQWKVVDPEKIKLISDMLLRGIELHGHKHEATGSIKIVYPEAEVFVVYLYHGHMADSYEFSYESRSYVINSELFFGTLRDAGIDISKIVQH